MSRTWAIDFETFYTSKYSLKTMIAEEYCRDERFDAYLMSVACDDGTEWAGHPRDFDWSQITDEDTVLAHNKYFDYTVWLRLHELGIVPEPRFKEFHCTANLTSYLCNCRALAQAIEFLYGEKISKQARADMKDKHWEDLTEPQQKVMIDYAIIDVRKCLQIWKDHSHKWPQFERDLSELTIQQGMMGIQIDVELLEKYLKWTGDALEKTEELLPWIEEGLKPTSPKGVAAQCRKVGIPCPPLKKEDEEGFIEWEQQHGSVYPWVTAVGTHRSLAKIYATFKTVKRRLRPDGTMPFAMKYFGGHTGRWSGDANLNMQNPRKESVFINEDGLMEIERERIDEAVKMLKKEKKLPAWAQCEINFRHLLIARPGSQMVTADLRQIEPRFLAWAVKDQAFLDGVAKGVSPYVVHARNTMGWDENKTQEDDPQGYALAKARILGLGYGCGWEKFISMAAAVGLDLTKDDPEEIEVVDPRTGDAKWVSGYGMTSRGIVKDFRDSNPKIASMDDENPGIWKKLDDAMRGSIGEDLIVPLPSGRKMVYRGIRAEFRTVPDKENEGKTKSKRVHTGDLGNRRVILYGGLLTENYVQAACRDIFAWIILRLHKMGIRCLFTCHDEGIFEIPKGSVTVEQFESWMKTCPPWVKGLPLDSEVKFVDHYCK